MSLTSLRIEFTGHIPSKKNSVIITKWGKRPSKAYERWEKEQLANLAGWPRVPGPVRIEYQFWVGGKDCPALFDLNNSVASIDDLLQKAGIIDEDNWAFLPDAPAKLRGFVRGEQITIVTIQSVEAPWIPILQTLQDKDAVRELAKQTGLTQVKVREQLWGKLQRIDCG